MMAEISREKRRKVKASRAVRATCKGRYTHNSHNHKAGAAKGLDLIECVLEEILAMDIQMVVMGDGEAHYEWLFRDGAYRHPHKLSANIYYDNALAHKIYAGADMFLMPSLFEPCGLAQLFSLRYGTIPIVRRQVGSRIRCSHIMSLQERAMALVLLTIMPTICSIQ